MDALRRPRTTLRAQLVGAFVVAAIVPAALVAALRAGSSADSERSRASTTIARSAVLLRQRVDAHLDAQSQAIAALAEAIAPLPLRPVADRPTPDGLQAWLDRQVRHHPAFVRIFVVDPKGRVATTAPALDATGQSALARVLVADRDYFRQAMATGSPFVTRLFTARVLDEPVVVVSAPMTLPSGERVGVVGGFLRLDVFARLANEVRTERTRVVLLDPAGVVVASTATELMRSRTLAATKAAVAPFVSATHPAGTPFWYDTLTAETRLASTMRTAHGWRVGVDLPRAAVYANTSGSILATLLALACGLAIGGFIMGGLARRLTRPLEGLAAAAQALGDEDTPLPEFVGAPDEVARLAADFSRMATRVSGMKASLEQQVVARTAELSEARDRAEREARLKSGFLAAMSHEIRTPMNSIVGMAELMAETPLDCEQREYCDTIRTSTDALLGVINDILDYSKIESQGVSLETLDFDLRLVVEDAVELLAVKAVTSGVDLAALIEPGFDGRFRGDPSRLRQVVVNLIGNAVKFTREGNVTVWVSALEPAATSARVRIEIVDTGIGMSADGLARLFRPFSQAEESTTRQYGGTGLGLTISKQIVERMGGAIGVTSQPGQGSTFWIEVPFERSQALPAPVAAGFAGTHAIVIEPLAASADALVRLLAEQGVHAVRVATGAQGCGALALRPSGYDLAFVNVNAPHVDTFAAALMHQPSAARTAIAALMPSGRRAVAVELVAGRPTHRLTRPIRRARLIECLAAMGGREAANTDAALPAVPAAVGTAASTVAADARPVATTPATPVSRKGHVLVADDYPANQRLVARLLEKRGYTVRIVADGAAAVEAALAEPFDVVLMDCNMPLLDGFEATARIRALEQGRRTPILAMTANCSPEDRAICLRAGMDDYLAKPIQATLVIEALERWTAARPVEAGAAPGGGGRA